MIKKLENILLLDRNGDAYAERLPENKEIQDKINEIIEYLNEKSVNNK